MGQGQKFVGGWLALGGFRLAYEASLLNRPYYDVLFAAFRQEVRQHLDE